MLTGRTMAHVLGVVGGSGIYDLPGLARVSVEHVETPYGAPSADIVRGWLGDTGLLFLPRHGKHHAFPPHQINYRANICALKKLGATHVVSRVRRRLDARGDRAGTRRRGRPVHRPDEAAHQHVLRRRHRRARRLRRSRLPAACLAALGGRERAPRAPRCTAAARTCAWRGRSSRPAPRAASTVSGA